MPSLVWCGQLLDPMKKNFLKILINSQLAKFAKFRMKNHFFLDKLYQQLFGYTLSLHWWYSISSLVWFGQLLDPMKNIFFKIFKISQFEKFAKFRMENHFFPRQAIPTTFLLYTLITLAILNTEFGLIWTAPWPNEKKFSKILKNSQFAKFAKFRMKTQLFPSLALPKIFLLYIFITLVILNTVFGMIWTTPWPDEKEFFFKFSKIRNSRNSQNSVWKTIFFLGKLYQKLFCFTLSLDWWYSMPSLVWFGQLLEPLKKNFF